MGTAKPRWATALAIVLRLVAIIVGATFAVHRLTLRLSDGTAGVDGSGGSARGSYGDRLADALTPDDATLAAMGRTALLAGLAAVARVTIGWLAITARRSLPSPGALDRPISERWSGLAIAVAVPGLVWSPLDRLVSDRTLLPDEALSELGSDPARLGALGLWALLVGLSIAPTVAGALSGGRPWSAGGSGGHPALAGLASRPSSEPVWRFGLPALAFGLSLALAEVVAGTGGLFDRYVTALGDGRPGDVLDLATPVIVAGALLVPAVDLGAAVLHRVERPRVPGSDRVRPGRWPVVPTVVLVTLVAAAAAAGAVIGPDGGSIGPALAAPSLGGPWLGTDELGRSVADRTATALAATLAGSAIPAVTASAVGAGCSS